MSATAEHIPAEHPPVSQFPVQPKTDAEVAFALNVRKAKALSQSTLAPKEYQGESGLPNVFIALEIAERIGASPLQVMQNLYIVNGKPGWSSSFLIATVNACGRFTPLRFEVQGGDDPFADTYRVRAHAKDKETGELCVGSWITWAMVKAEGWHSKSGSKWKTMPEQMFMYRAAAFWTRAYAPEQSLGIQTSDEVQDTTHVTVHSAQRGDAALEELGEKLKQRAALAHQGGELVDTSTGEVLPAAAATKPEAKSVKELKAELQLATTMDELAPLLPLIEEVPDDEERAALGVIYDSRVPAIAG